MSISREGAKARRREGGRESAMADVEALSAIAIEHALRIHRALGPGLFESVYEVVLAASPARAMA